MGRHRTGDVELSYTFLPEHWGRGYAYEACAAVLDAAFDTDRGLARVVAVTQVVNVRSRRLLDRLAMVAVEKFVEHGEPQVMYAATRPCPRLGPSESAASTPLAAQFVTPIRQVGRYRPGPVQHRPHKPGENRDGHRR
ncbi:GNAT family N-acetyltransferase [Micromonospora sp. LZ34]